MQINILQTTTNNFIRKEQNMSQNTFLRKINASYSARRKYSTLMHKITTKQLCRSQDYIYASSRLAVEISNRDPRYIYIFSRNTLRQWKLCVPHLIKKNRITNIIFSEAQVQPWLHGQGWVGRGGVGRRENY